MKFQAELTDTFNGEPNYSWCRREEFDTPDDASDLAIVRQAKRLMGVSGVRCQRADLGETIELRPYGMCQILLISPIY